ncbi:mRNA cap guanine-n7 methyltransferase [Anaeramoeba flamelloides]|uniref:mRNA cap guanine-N(7) methyltransferase n=1 Tax=Anaeramoeba flamelloides TaxID=1746091 RepID=A0AAV7ZZ69_9EUKA|nr:mRNA cap guanine-n7 methyltransferase [Anaeramoeba flamelloides]KAJ6237545.1 mRNA cap guanine-n7 methyltransferase [Anaeramoeba flamelloides]
MRRMTNEKEFTTTERKRSLDHLSNIQNHYSTLDNESKHNRNNSSIFYLRNINNWIKLVLMGKYLMPHSNVFDVCCGKGGDLLKWQNLRVRNLVAADVTLPCVIAAQKRYSNLKNRCFRGEFIYGDCFLPGVVDKLPNGFFFDFASCQFALHYSFSSQKRIENLLENVSKRLKKGGHFVGTIPNSNWIIKKLRSVEGYTIQNSKFKIEFEKTSLQSQKEKIPIFGAEYKFYLNPSVVGVSEFLVHFPTLVKLAKKYGLELDWKQTFHNIYLYGSQFKNYLLLMKKNNCFNQNNTISQIDWDLMNLYLGFAFKKVTDPQDWNPNETVDLQSRKIISQEDIIVLDQSEFGGRLYQN